jgi:16S rRNA (guanine527-N7)-methyltransferase
MADTAPLNREEIAKFLMFHVKHEAWEDLSRFGDILTQQNQVMNLVGPATIAHFWQRHVLDSAQLLNHAPEAKRWADLGAGAGLPGIVLAILFKHNTTAVGQKIWLIDSLGKRCRFLQNLVDELNLPAIVINDRVENIDLQVDIVTARAFAPMERLLTYAESFFKKGAEAWILKGENVDSELLDAGKRWRFAVDKYPSVSDPRGRVIHLKRVSRVR